MKLSIAVKLRLNGEADTHRFAPLMSPVFHQHGREPAHTSEILPRFSIMKKKIFPKVFTRISG